MHAGRYTVGLVNAWDGPPSGERAASVFGGVLDAVVFGGTHESLTATDAGVLFVNPGSPSLADQTSVALLRITASGLTAEIRPLGP